MPNFVTLGLMISEKKIFKDFQYIFSFVAMATRVLIRIKLFEEFLKRAMLGSFLFLHQLTTNFC